MTYIILITMIMLILSISTLIIRLTVLNKRDANEDEYRITLAGNYYEKKSYDKMDMNFKTDFENCIMPIIEDKINFMMTFNILPSLQTYGATPPEPTDKVFRDRRDELATAVIESMSLTMREYMTKYMPIKSLKEYVVQVTWLEFMAELIESYESKMRTK